MLAAPARPSNPLRTVFAAPQDRRPDMQQHCGLTARPGTLVKVADVVLNFVELEQGAVVMVSPAAAARPPGAPQLRQ
jgi:hypothetical protein